jgi:hypothetical protein
VGAAGTAAARGLNRPLAILVAGAFFMENLDGTIIQTAVPAIGRDFGLRAVDVNAAITAYLLSVAISVPLGGWLANRLGVRAVFQGAIALFTVAVRRRGSVALLLGLGYVATGPVYHALQSDSDFPLWVDLAARLVTGAAAVGWGLFVQAYRGLTESLRSHAARLEAEAVRTGELERFSSRLASLDDAQRATVDAVTKGVVAKLLHQLSVRLKADAGTPQGERNAAAVRDLFDLP